MHRAAAAARLLQRSGWHSQLRHVRIAKAEKVPLKRSFDQYLLKNEHALASIANAAGINQGDRVLEIGSGTGNLTKLLLDSPAATVLGVEADEDMQRHLRSRYAQEIAAGRLRLVPHDIRKIFNETSALIEQAPDVCVGNIPYSISSEIVRGVASSWLPITRACVLLVQEEFARKIASPAGTEDYGPIAAYMGLLAQVEVLNTVNRQLFEPVPKVDSAVVRITPLQPDADAQPHEHDGTDVYMARQTFCQRLENFVNLCFTKANKTLKSIFNSSGPQEYLIRCLEHAIEQANNSGSRSNNKIDVQSFEADRYAYVKRMTESILHDLELTPHRARHVDAVTLRRLFDAFADHGVHFDVSIAERTRQRYSSSPKHKPQQ